jgi:Sulfotransferase family
MRSDYTGLSRLKPENVVWIFGYGRSGSTWLSDMMGELKNHVLWSEPMIGLLFGGFYYNLSHYNIDFSEFYLNHHGFIFGPQQEAWPRLIRSFFLEAAFARFPRMGSGDILVVKEPNGSVGAPLLMEALPESRMILLLRDPRDVVASNLDAFKRGSWGLRTIRQESISDIPVEAVVNEYLQNISNAKQAYDYHKGPKVLIKYEDLGKNALCSMRYIYSALGIHVVQEELTHVVDKYSWEKIPDESKGEGKFYRKATPGGWKKDLTAEQVKVVERATTSLIKEFYS